MVESMVGKLSPKGAKASFFREKTVLAKILLASLIFFNA